MHSRFARLAHPLAITMWDFSWLERRWPGAGYESWELALDQLAERGYDAVRIDAYPHFVRHDPEMSYRLPPNWNQQAWGAPDWCEVRIFPELTDFIALCRDRGLLVGLSTWFRRDELETNRLLATPEALGDAWMRVLRSIEREGLLDSILYVDLCNEWPVTGWTPFYNYHEQANDPRWESDRSLDWMTRSIAMLHDGCPAVPCTFSNVGVPPVPRDRLGSYEMIDFYEPHIWMAQANGHEFNRRINYNYEGFDPEAFRRVVRYAEPLYRANERYWQYLLAQVIGAAADFSRAAGRPLMTTECWAIVDYKDWPLLDWGWVKELNELGTFTAAAEGSWAAIATSNFCGPQFVGMWRDVDWHRRLTARIHEGDLPR